MKRLLTGALALIFAISASATTLNPVQLLNPAGSTSGQTIVSTGPSSAPAWSNVPATALTGIIPVINGGTGVTTAAAELSRIGALSTTAAASTYAPITSPTFTGAVTVPAGTTLTTPNIVGVTNGSAAAAGSLGEYPTPTNLSSVPLTNNVAANAASVSLTAGDYDVQCIAGYAPAGTTVMETAWAGVSTTSATQGGFGTYEQLNSFGNTAGQGATAVSPIVRINVSSATTAYCIAQSFFTTSTETVSGFIRARRIH